MGRLIALILWTAIPFFGQAQRAGVDQAGVCSRCHVSSSLEWSISKHSKAGTNCQSCHGESLAHVANEQDAIKPDRRPRGAAIAMLCQSCHTAGCPKTKQTADCQTCHQVHALVDPKQRVSGDAQSKALDAKLNLYRSHLALGDQMAAAGKWPAARDSYADALKEYPGSERAEAGYRMSGRRLHPGVPGLQAGSSVDTDTGLPKELTLPELGIHLLLIDGGDFDMGSESRPDTKPVHTVHVDAFYLSPTELTQRQWTALMGKSPNAKQGAELPVDQVSWKEAQSMLAVLNDRVPGRGFRLPTEAEWEFAAHTPGLKNMADSLSEWCSSLWRPYPYHTDDGREDLQAEGLRVVRGGNFAEPGEWRSPAARHAARPDQRLETIGIRLAYSVP